MSDQKGRKVNWDETKFTSSSVFTRQSGFNALAQEAEGVSTSFLDSLLD